MTSHRLAMGISGAMLVSVAAGGCNLFQRDEAQPLTADAFVQQRVEGRTNPEPIDQPGQVIVDGVRPPAAGEDGQPVPPRPVGVNDISPAVRQTVRAPGDPAPRTPTGVVKEQAATAPAAADVSTAPAPVPAPRATAQRSTATASPTTGPDPSGQYVVFGTVLASVNTRPIYAHKLLATLDSALRAEAQRYDERRFKPVAAKLIADEIRNQQRNELIFALAEKSLDAREKSVAEALTAQWQNEEITKSGGSLELAKRRWADDGWDFNDRLDYQYRVNMTRVFYQRRVFPLVHVTASDIRNYYELNKATAFTRPARVKFRVIRIDPREQRLAGGTAEGKQLAAGIRAKAVAANANFEQLARATNDPALKGTGGLVGGGDGWLEKGSYVSEKVENAVWELRPGGVTEVIEDRGAFYVAKLEEREEAVARQFEDAEVQKDIEETLRAQQFKRLQEQRQEKLLKDAVIQEHPQMMQIALDMAMQRYPAWAAEGTK